DKIEDVVVRVAIVEHAGATADRRPSIAGHVPRETNARGQLEGMLLLRRTFEDFHAVDEVSGVRHQPSDVDRRQGLAGDGIPRETGPVHGDRSVEQRRRAGRPLVGIEYRYLVAFTLGRGQVVEAQAR